ncbi:MAG: ABC transporter ATP-binding protein [Anaerovoracaceae bacterium]
MEVINIKELTKDFDDKKFILNKVNLNIKEGSIYGLIGANGAGKTTLIKHITGLIKPNSGGVYVDGNNIYNNEVEKAKMAFIPDELFFFFNYNLQDMKNYISKIYQNWSEKRYKELVRLFNVDDNKILSKFSKGMQKQAAFILAMSTMPKYLILDEPIDGLDPIMRRKVWECVMEDVAERNMTVFISSHNLREIEGICDTIGIISRGKVLLEGELDDLKSDIHKIQIVFDKEKEQNLDKLNILHREKNGSVDLLIVRGKLEEIQEITLSFKPIIFDVLPLTLEEIFIYEVGEGNEINEILI